MLMKNPLVIVFLSIALTTGCASTVTPNVVKTTEASYDASTPASIPPKSSGFIKFTFDANGKTNGALITENKLAEYNQLIAVYRLQFKVSDKVDLDKDEGIDEAPNMDGKNTFKIDAQHLQYLFKLERWKRANRPEDTLWMKTKERIGL